MFTIANHNTTKASAWLPQAGNYKYHAAIHTIDQQSIKNKKNRAKAFREIQEIIYLLTEYRYKNKLPPNSTQYLQIQEDIDYLSKQATLLTSYNDEQMHSSSVEYGLLNSKISFGIKALHKDNKFDSGSIKYTASYANSADIFAKFKLLERNSYIFSIQPQLCIHKESTTFQELFYETALLTGTTSTKGKFTLVVDSAIALGHGISSTTHKKRYYSFAVSESIKLPYGLMLTNFSKYYLRNNYGSTYNDTIYEQLSIAKEINFDTVKQNSFTISFGYFWNRSLKYKSYKISGTVFSIWTEI